MSSIFDLPDFQRLLTNYSPDQQAQIPPAVELYNDPYRQREREDIERIFANLPVNSYKREIQDRLLLGDTPNHLGAWYELFVYDWLAGLSKNPIPQPTLAGAKSRPDFLIESNRLQIFIEVAVVQESRADKDVRQRGPWWPAAIATFRTMRERLIDKMGQHPGIPQNAAYLICLCLNSFLIDLGEVKTCLLGGEAININTGELVPLLDGDIFEVHGNELFVKYTHVSGVLVARCNRSTLEDGYKLVFGYVQNPYADISIPTNEFGDIRRHVIVSRNDTHFSMKWI